MNLTSKAIFFVGRLVLPVVFAAMACGPALGQVQRPRLESGADALSFSIAASPSGKTAAVSRLGGAVSLIDLDTMQESSYWQVGKTGFTWIGYASESVILAIEQLTDGTGLVEQIHRIDTATGDVSVMTKYRGIASATISDGLLYLALGNEVKIWDVIQQKVRTSIRLDAEVARLASSMNSKVFAVTAEGSVIEIGPAGRQTRRGRLTLPAPYSALAVSRDGNQIAAMNGRIPAFAFSDGVEVLDFRTSSSTLLPIPGVAGALFFTANGSRIVAATGFAMRAKASSMMELTTLKTDRISEWSIAEKRIIRTVEVPNPAYAAAAIPARENDFLTQTWGGGTYLVNLTAQSAKRIFAAAVLAKALRFVTPKRLGVVASDGSQFSWNLANGRMENFRSPRVEIDKLEVRHAFAGLKVSGIIEHLQLHNDVDCEIRVQYSLEAGAMQSVCIPKKQIAAIVPPSSEKVLWHLQNVTADASADGMGIALGLSFTNLQGDKPGESRSALFQFNLSNPSQYKVALLNDVASIRLLRYSDDAKLLIAAVGTDSQISEGVVKPAAINAISAFDSDSGVLRWTAKYPSPPAEIIDMHLELGALLVVADRSGLIGTFGTKPQEGWGRYLVSGRTSAMVLAPVARYMVAGTVGGEFNMVDPKNNFSTSNFGEDGSSIEALALSADETMLASADDKGAIKLWQLRTRREVAAMTAWGGNEWLVLTSEGAFAGTDAATRRTYLRYLQGAYRLDQIYDAFSRPEIVADILQGKRLTRPLISDFQEFLRRPPPTVKRLEASTADNSNEGVIEADLGDRGGGIGPSLIYVNGKLAWIDGEERTGQGVTFARSVNRPPTLSRPESTAELGSSVPLAADAPPDTASVAASRPARLKVRVKLPVGDVEVALITQNSNATVQGIPARISVKGPERTAPPKTFILSIGVQKFADHALDLTFAAKDAGDFAVAMTQALTSDSAQRQVVTIPLINLTVAEMTAKLATIAESAEPQDTLILFMSTHGVTRSEGLGLLGADYDGSAAGRGILPIRKLLSQLVRVPAQQQLVVIDACYAGQFEQSIANLYSERLRSLARTGGIHVLTAAQPLSAAREGFRGEQNGHLTHSLLEVLRTEAPASASQLGTKTVRKMSGEPGAVQSAQYWEFGADISFGVAGSLRRNPP